MTPFFVVTFANGEAVVHEEPPPLGVPHRPLWISSSAGPGENPSHPNGPLQPGAVAHDGLHLSITRPKHATQNAVIMCGITGPHLQAVEIAASYSAEVGPTMPGDLWAVTLVGRDGNVGVDDPNEKYHHVGATCQTRGPSGPPNPEPVTLALGAGNASNVRPRAVDELIPVADAFPAHAGKRFELRATLNRPEKKGAALLMTPGHRWHMRTWDFPTMGPISLLGVGVAINTGTGPASVIVHGFEVSTL